MACLKDPDKNISFGNSRPLSDSNAADGITDDAVIFGMEDKANSFSIDEENSGFRLAFREQNDTGPIHGRRIEWQAYSRPGSTSMDVLIANFRRLIEKDHVFAMVNFAGGNATETLLHISREARVPYLFPHSGLVPPSGERYLFASYPNLESESLIMFRYLGKEFGAKRIAICHDRNVYGMFYVERLKSYASRFGYEFTGALPIESRNPGDLSGSLRALLETHPDAVFMGLYPDQAKAVMEAKAKLNWNGLMVSSGPLTDEQYLNLPDGKAEGTLGFCYYPDPMLSAAPGIIAYREAIARYGMGKTPNRYSLYGYVFGKLILEGLRRSGRELTREAYIEAMETISDWDAGGVMPNVTMTKDNHHAQPAGFIGILRNGRFTALTHWLTA